MDSLNLFIKLPWKKNFGCVVLNMKEKKSFLYVIKKNFWTRNFGLILFAITKSL